MVPLFTGHLSSSHGLLPAFKALRSMPTAARGVLVVITELGEAEMAISEQGLIIGALIRGKNEQGLFALKKIMDWQNGKYAFFEGDEYPNDHIKKTLRMDIVSIIKGAEGDQASSGTTPAQQQRVDISSVHNKVLPPQAPNGGQQVAYQSLPSQSQGQTPGIAQPQGQLAGQQNHQGQPVFAQQQSYTQSQPGTTQTYGQQQAPQQLANAQPLSSEQRQPMPQPQQQVAQQYPSQQQPMAVPGGAPQHQVSVPQGYSQMPDRSSQYAGAQGNAQAQGYRPPQSLSQSGLTSPNQQPVTNQPSNTVPADNKAPAGNKPKKRKFASTNFAMDVFGTEAPVAPAPKVGETVEDDLLRNLSDLNRLGSSTPGLRATPNQAPVNQQQSVAANPNLAPTGNQPAPGIVASQVMVPQASLMPPPGALMPPVGMMPPAGMVPPEAVRPTGGPAGALPSGISNYQHQQSINELQQQAMADEAALMQAISSTSTPIYVRPGVANQLPDTLLSEQQIRAAQSISGNFEQSNSYQQPGMYQQESAYTAGGAQSPAISSVQPLQRPQSQLSAPQGQPVPAVAPRAVSPSGGFNSSKINPTKTLLESDLFFVDDELTGDPSVPDVVNNYVNDPGTGAGYAPSAMSSRTDAYAPQPASPAEIAEILQPPSLGANFSQSPSFGPGSSSAAPGAGAKNPGSAILESMKRRNLGGQSNDETAGGYNSSPPPVPSQLTGAATASPTSANALSHYNEIGGVGTSSSSNIPNIGQQNLSQSAAVQSGIYDAIPSSAPSPGQANSYGYGKPTGYDERGASPQLIPPPDLSTSSTFPGRSQPESYEEESNPQVGIATSSRIARSVGVPNEKLEKGRKDENESASAVARSRIRTAPSHQSGGMSTFMEKNKMMVIIIGVVLLVLIIVGGIIGALFAMHVIKT